MLRCKPADREGMSGQLPSWVQASADARAFVVRVALKRAEIRRAQLERRKATLWRCGVFEGRMPEIQHACGALMARLLRTPLLPSRMFMGVGTTA